MSDVEKYIAQRKKTDPEFAEEFEEGYREFEIGVLLRQVRKEAGMTCPMPNILKIVPLSLISNG